MATKKASTTPAKKSAAKSAAGPETEKSAVKAAAKKTASKKATAAAAPAAKKQATHAEIAKLAHSHWEQRGGHHGSHNADWLRAEKELNS